MVRKGNSGVTWVRTYQAYSIYGKPPVWENTKLMLWSGSTLSYVAKVLLAKLNEAKDHPCLAIFRVCLCVASLAFRVIAAAAAGQARVNRGQVERDDDQNREPKEEDVPRLPRLVLLRILGLQPVRLLRVTGRARVRRE